MRSLAYVSKRRRSSMGTMRSSLVPFIYILRVLTCLGYGLLWRVVLQEKICFWTRSRQLSCPTRHFLRLILVAHTHTHTPLTSPPFTERWPDQLGSYPTSIFISWCIRFRNAVWFCNGGSLYCLWGDEKNINIGWSCVQLLGFWMQNPKQPWGLLGRPESYSVVVDVVVLL